MIELHRGSVQTWECDQMGHMNVQFYVAKAQQAAQSLLLHLGLGPSAMRQQSLAFVPIDQHIRFLREQHAGAPFMLTGGIVEQKDDGLLRVYIDMLNTASGVVAATFAVDMALADAQSRERRPLPREIVERISAFEIDVPAHGQPKGLELKAPSAPPTLDIAKALDLVPTYEGAVTPEMVDGDGYLLPHRHMGIISDAIPNLLSVVNGIDRSRNGKRGGAALEYRMIHHTPVREGDIVVVRSGLKAFGEKTIIWGHWMFNLETGKAVVTAEAVAISLDLEARKAVPIEPEMRERYAEIAKPEMVI